MANANDVVIGFTAIGDDQVVNAINSVTTHVEKQTKSVDRMSKTYRKAANDSNVMRRSQRQMSGMMGQMGHQVQDVAVQLQSGTNAMIVFGQQGSQMASVLGAKGAMFGALFAIGAAIYTYVEKASIEASKKLREFEEELAKTATTGKTFDDSLRSIAIVEISNKLDVLKNSQEQLTEKQQDNQDFLRRNDAFLKTYQSRIKQLQMGLPEFGLGVSMLTKEFYFNSENIKKAEDELSVYTATANANQAQIDKLTKQLKALKEGSNDPYGYLSDKATAFGKKVDDLTLKYGKSEIALLRLKATELANGDSSILANLNTKIDKYEAYKKVVDAAAKAEKDKNDVVRAGISAEDRFIKSITTQVETMNLSKAGTIAYKASLLNLNEEQQNAVFNVLQRVAAEEKLTAELAAQKKIDDDRKKKEDKVKSDFAGLESGFKTEEDLILESEMRKLKILDEMYAIRGEKDKQYYDLRNKIQIESDNALVEAERQKQMTVAGAMNSQLQQLASFFDESSALGKAAFIANQGMAIANAIISAEAASAKALELYPAMPAYAGMIKAMGYASAGAIAGQTIASFEGGGITFDGVRSGGLDGKGGRMAIVHPNEKITDLEKGGDTGGAVNVSFNINAVDTQGIDKLLYERRGMITSMVQKAVNNRGKRIM